MADDSTFPIAPSSPRMINGDDGETRKLRRTDRADFPFAACNVGYSFAVPLSFNEGSLRVRVARENGRGTKKFRVVKWDACYEVGCISDSAPDAVSRETLEPAPAPIAADVSAPRQETPEEQFKRLYPNGVPKPQEDD